MRTIIKPILIATSILAVASCQKEIDTPVSPKEIQIVLNAKIPETKTGIYYEEGSYLPYWQKGDQLGVLFSMPTETGSLKNDAVFSNVAEDDSMAQFEFEGIISGIEETSEVTLYSYYPAKAGNRVYKDNVTGTITFGLDIPSSQSPIYNEEYGYSFDPQSDILIAKPVTCQIDPDVKNQVDMFFKRISSVLRIELNTDETVSVYGELVSAIKFETSSGDISGRVVVDLQKGSYSKVNNKSDSQQLNAVLDTKTVHTYIGYPNSNNVFFGVAPVTIAEGSTLTFTIETVDPNTGRDAHKIVKTIASSPKIAFESATPTVIKLNIKEEEVGLADTASSEDYSGDYLLTNTDRTSAAVKWENGNNLKIVEVTSIGGGNVLYDPSVVEIENSKFTLTKIVSGDYSGMYTIQDVDGNYLYAAGSGNNNYLKAQNTPDINSYWNITIDDGVWSVIATKSKNNKYLQYNTSSKLFACYSSASQSPVVFVPWEAVKEARRPIITGPETLSLDSEAIEEGILDVTFNSFVESASAKVYDDEDKTTSCSWLTVSVTEKTVKYAVSKNDTGAARMAYIFIEASNAEEESVEFKIKVTQVEEGAAATVTDKLTNANTYNGSGTTYKAWGPVSDLSGATYEGNSAGGNKDNISIQLRSSESTSGIVTTKTGGIVKKIVVKWNSGTTEGRTLDIYGKNDAYLSPNDLYGDKKGAQLGSFTYSSNKLTDELVIEGSYTYIGFRSRSSALYLDEITIEWEPNGSTTPGTGEGGDGGDTTDPEPDTANIVLDFANLNEQASKNNSSYTGTWEMNTPNGDWIITNFNNNSKLWTYIKCGSSNTALEAKINTKQSFSGSFKKVIVTIDNVSAQYVNYSKLIVASDSEFSKDVQESVVDLSKGDISFPVSNPVPNAYYSLVFNMQKGSNGTLQISKVVYSVE